MILADIRQAANHDCGIAVCRIVMRYYGKKWFDDYEKKLSVCEIDGTDPRNIEVLFRQSGFGVLSGEMTIADLRHCVGMGRPVIALIQRMGVGHYIVVSDARPRIVEYQCPADGPTRVSVRKFKESWSDVGRMGAIYKSFGISPFSRKA